jgi:hypothetical protein
MLCLFLDRNAEFRSNLQKGNCLLSFVGDEEVRMVDNKELESGLKAMAEDFHLPGGGHKKLSRLVAGGGAGALFPYRTREFDRRCCDPICEVAYVIPAGFLYGLARRLGRDCVGQGSSRAPG